MENRVVVTGASGHIGYNVAKQLLEQNFDVLLLIRSRNENIEDLVNKGAKIHKADLTQPETYQSTLQGMDCLFHLAAENTTDTSDEERVINNTYGLTKTVLDTAVNAGVKTVIYTSSVVVIGRSPSKNRLLNENDTNDFLESPYVKGKFMAEAYCQQVVEEGKLDVRRVYPAWVVGPGDQRLTPPHKVIKDAVAKGQKFYFNGGISIAAVEEIAKAHINAWLKGKRGEKYVLGGENLTFKEFYSIIAANTGAKPPGLFIPKFVIYLGALVLKMFFGKKAPVDPAYVKTVVGSYSWYDSTKAKEELGYAIPPATETLSKAVGEARQRLAGLKELHPRKVEVERKQYAPDDVLLITGVPGWLGNRMLDIFMNGDTFGNNATNRKIRLLVLPSFKGLVENMPENVEIVYGDLTNKDSLREAVKGVKAVYHLAGLIYPKKTQALYTVNYEGTKNLVDACIEQGVRRIMFMSTDSTCGYGRKNRIFDEHTEANPYKNYGKSKYLAEKYILDKTKEGLIDGTSLRGFWFFGPFMPERNRAFLDMFKWPRQLVFGNGKNYRSISHTDNITQAFIRAEQEPKTYGKWYWIGNEKIDYTVDDIYQNIADGLGTEYKPIHIPNFMCDLFDLADRFLDLFGILHPTIHAAGKFHKDIAGEIDAAKRDFGYDPKVTFEEIKKEVKAFAG